MRLLLTHPTWATIDCDECKAWMIDPTTGQRNERSGQPLARPKHVPTPCWACKKTEGASKRDISVGREASLSDRNWRTWTLYNEQRACGGEVTDDIVRKNLGIIHEVIRGYERAVQTALLSAWSAGPTGRTRT